MAEIDARALGLVLAAASLVAIPSRRVGLPSTARLVAAGIARALFPIGAELPLSQELIVSVSLAPLLFEAALPHHDL